MRRHHAHTIAGSILLLAASVLWVGAGLLANRPEFVFLFVPAIVFLLAGVRLMWRGEIPDE